MKANAMSTTPTGHLPKAFLSPCQYLHFRYPPTDTLEATPIGASFSRDVDVNVGSSVAVWDSTNFKIISGLPLGSRDAAHV
jgi:hypothetical protein